MTTSAAKLNLHSIEKLSTLVDELSKYPKIFWCFRGQTQDWALTPNIFRYGYKEQIEKEIYSDFRNSVRLYPSPLVDFKNPWEMLCYAQHFGVPTRLIDWTINPLMAAYFAVEDAYTSRTDDQINDKQPPEGVIYALNVTHHYAGTESDRLGFRGVALSDLKTDFRFLDYLISSKQKNKKNEQQNKIEIIQPPDIDHRIKAQGGLFSVDITDSQTESHQTILANVLTKITIPYEAKYDIKTELYRMGIHAGSVYPDMAGLGKYLTDRRDREYYIPLHNANKKKG